MDSLRTSTILLASDAVLDFRTKEPMGVTKSKANGSKMEILEAEMW